MIIMLPDSTVTIRYDYIIILETKNINQLRINTQHRWVLKYFIQQKRYKFKSDMNNLKMSLTYFYFYFQRLVKMKKKKKLKFTVDYTILIVVDIFKTGLNIYLSALR